MKIACIIHSLDGGGAERVLALLASGLATRGHQVSLVTLDQGTRDRHDVSSSVERVCLDVVSNSHGGIRKLSYLRRRLAAIRQAIKKTTPDVVLSFCDRTNIDVLMASAGLDVPVVISERSDPAKQRLGRFWEFARRRLYRRSARVIALTSEIAVTLQPLHRLCVLIIASSVHRPEEYPLRNLPPVEAEPVVLGVGRLEHEKGFDRLIQAFAGIAERFPAWRLRIVGEGSKRQELQELANRLGVEKQLAMPGWGCPIWPEYDRAAIFVLPSRYEGFPSVLLEAMASARASIAMKCQSGSREIITNGVDGLLVEEDIDALADAMALLIGDRERRNRIAAEAHRSASRYQVDAMVSQYEAALSEAIRRHFESV